MAENAKFASKMRYVATEPLAFRHAPTMSGAIRCHAKMDKSVEMEYVATYAILAIGNVSALDITSATVTTSGTT